ncbi:MAG TPA: peptide chain release factor N(5)-glutamine methyltransferase [Longimicrobiales bacterium]|nr:peptide chain release factor N(5)-glutamine methyltransferase [Longimicrobiales bacterium]
MAERALELSRKAAALLQERGFEQARLEAELLLAAALGIDRLQLYLQHDRPVAAAELEIFRASVRRRLRHEPVQYILGETSFRTLRLGVDRRVLIPRPETEVLVGEVLRWAERRGGGGAALDLGTGSGAIALSLAAEGGFDRVVASDVSAEALAVAGANAQRNALTDRVELRCGALWDVVAPGERFRAIVSNPPYVGEAERALLAPEVREWEPPGALFAGPDGMAVIEALIAGAVARLEAGGLLALEIGATQAGATCAAVARAAGLGRARVVPDLTGRDRIVLVEANAG